MSASPPSDLEVAAVVAALAVVAAASPPPDPEPPRSAWADPANAPWNHGRWPVLG